MSIKTPFLSLIISIILFSCSSQEKKIIDENQNLDMLPSWNEGNTKASIIEFVKEVTDETSPNYVEPKDRIATFDNDGNLWSEQPYYFQLQFTLDRVKSMAADHPEWEEDSLMLAVLNDDMDAIMKSGMHGLLKIVMISHAGMSTEEFEKIVLDWINTAKHPKTGKLYREMVYQPMLELLDYLRANDFKVFIVSGGGVEFMRPWGEETYGVPRDQVIGSSIKTEFMYKDDETKIIRLAEIDFIDDKEGKPIGIHKFIGRKPIFASGNSDGDLQMLQYTASGEGKRFMLYLHHTDSVREWAYDKDSHIGRLDKGLEEAAKHNWTVIDMKEDWKVIYPFELN